MSRALRQHAVRDRYPSVAAEVLAGIGLRLGVKAARTVRFGDAFHG
jgi:hypothetical protein